MKRSCLKLSEKKTELKDEMELLKLEVFDLNYTLFVLKYDPLGEDQYEEKMIRRIEQENFELILMLEEERLLLIRENG